MRAVSRRPPNQAVSVCETLLRPLEYFDTAENDLAEIEMLTILDDFDAVVNHNSDRILETGCCSRSLSGTFNFSTRQHTLGTVTVVF